MRGLTHHRAGAWSLVGVLFAWSMLPLAVLLWDVTRKGGVLTGTDSMIAGFDQQLYMQQMRDAGQDAFISNEFRLGQSDGVYLQPMFLISGLLWQMGLSVKLVLLVWKPVACVLLGVGVWAYARRLLDGRAARITAAALAIFYFSPVLPLLVWSGNELGETNNLFLHLTSGDPMPALNLWGYLHTVSVIGLMVLFLLGVERVVDPERRAAGRSRRWYLGWVTVMGIIVGWVHPWQGATLIVIVAGLAAWGRFAPRYRVLALPVVATGIPMVYLFLLSKLDDDWVIFAEQNAGDHPPVWIVLAAFAPLALPALAGLRRHADDEQERMLLLWAAAGVVAYVTALQFPSHALQGLTIPLAVLAVRGWQRLRLPGAVGVACAAALTIPGTLFILDTFKAERYSPVAPYVFTPGEDDALQFLDDAPPGGVLSRYYLGGVVPAQTGHDTWVGHFAWTPEFHKRRRMADRLFEGRMSPSESQRLVAAVRPRYLLADCQKRADLGRLLGPMVARTHRFGCAAVYEVQR